VPRLAVINAAGANTLYGLVESAGCVGMAGARTGAGRRFYAEMDRQQRRASTIASAIEINRPV